MTQTPEALRARAARRRHLQQRQTVIFGTLVAALLLIGLVAGGMWTGVIPSPVSVPINDGNAAAPTPVVPPCPPEGALPVPYSEIGVNVFNGTNTQGLAATTAAKLRAVGLQTALEQNGSAYGGVVQLTAGPTGVAAAYTVAALFPSSQIVLDARDDDSVDVLVGDGFEDLIPVEEVTLDPAAPIPAPETCSAVTVETEAG